MTQDDIIRMAECAGLTYDDRLMKFAEAIARPETAAAVEREACAQVCDVLAVHPEYGSEAIKVAAITIRARSN